LAHNRRHRFDEGDTMRNRRPLAAAVLALAAPWCAAQDTLLARNLAATCANCHGTNGAARDEMAALAGVPAATVIAQLADFKSGARPATVMGQITKGYSDEQLALIAGYFAVQPAKK
jgi:cytochrome c553